MDISSKENREFILKYRRTKMPFGRFSGRYLIDLPEPYVVWFNKNGYPKGELGEMLQLTYEIKLNGLEKVIRKIPLN